MKIFLHSLGTRGDVEPFLAIGSKLQKMGHEVVYTFPEQFKNLCPSNARFYPLNRSFIELIESPEGKTVMGKASWPAKLNSDLPLSQGSRSQPHSGTRTIRVNKRGKARSRHSPPQMQLPGPLVNDCKQAEYHPEPRSLRSAPSERTCTRRLSRTSRNSQPPYIFPFQFRLCLDRIRCSKVPA